MRFAALHHEGDYRYENSSVKLFFAAPQQVFFPFIPYGSQHPWTTRITRKPDDIVFISKREATCNECGENPGKGTWITLDEEIRTRCLACADLDHLVTLGGHRPDSSCRNALRPITRQRVRPAGSTTARRTLVHAILVAWRKS